MLLPDRHLSAVIVLSVMAGGIATLAAAVSARRLARDNQTLRQAVSDLGAGRVPASDGRRLTAELEQLRTELGATAAALAGTREREQALESARRELVSWVSHDLRTPLAGLRAMAEALEDGVVDDPTQYYKQIGASVDRLSGMVDDLFDLSRIQAGAFSRHAETINLDDLASDCIAALTPLASARGVSLTGQAGGGTLISGNGAELNRALTNLIANAIRHTRTDGSVRVTVTPGDAAVEVSVTDQCGGIPVEDLGRVFDVGFRGESARTPRPTESVGAGLGLAITRGIVEAHGGSVDVENLADGCSFRMRLPALS
jgi:signal transduction histidine kinase